MAANSASPNAIIHAEPSRLRFGSLKTGETPMLTLLGSLLGFVTSAFPDLLGRRAGRPVCQLKSRLSPRLRGRGFLMGGEVVDRVAEQVNEIGEIVILLMNGIPVIDARR